MSKIIPTVIHPTGLFKGKKSDADIIDHNAVAMLEIYNNFTPDNPQKMIDEYKQILADDFVYDEPGTGMVYPTQEDFFTSMKEWKGAFSNCKGTINRTIRSGNIVIQEITFTGTHDGMFKIPGYETPASGNDVDLRCCMIVECDKDGKVKKCTDYFDSFGMMKTVGALPAARED